MLRSPNYMQINRANPVRQNININNYNLRPRPHRIQENNLIQVPLIQLNINNNNRNNRMAESARAFPPKFSGSSTENGWFWLQKFEAYLEFNEIDDAHKIGQFILFIGNACENWYLTLPENRRDTYAHLRASFIQKYGNIASIADEEIFYNKKQQENESAEAYINYMLTLGNKMQLDQNIMLSTIKRGLLPELRAYVISHNVNNISDLIQRAQLGETIQQLNKNSRDAHVHFANPIVKTAKTDDLKEVILQSNNEIKDVVTNLTKEFVKMNMSATEMTQTHRARSQSPIAAYTPYAHQNTAYNDRQITNTYNQQPPYCNICLCYGHKTNNCRQNQQNSFTYRPNYQRSFYNNNYRPQFMAPRANNFNRPNYTYQPRLTNNQLFFNPNRSWYNRNMTNNGQQRPQQYALQYNQNLN